MYHGNLFEYVHLSPDKPLDLPYQLRLACDIAKGCAFMHNLTPPVLHRDLKSPNVLIASLSENDEIVAKVADFGTSQAVVSKTKGRTVANPVWLAPEIMKDEPYSEKADIYSFGVILWELCTRKQFFSEISFMSALEQKVIEGERPGIPSTCLAEYKTLIENCWSGDPYQRPSFSECVRCLGSILKAVYPHLYEVAISEKPIAQGISEKVKVRCLLIFLFLFGSLPYF